MDNECRIVSKEYESHLPYVEVKWPVDDVCWNKFKDANDDFCKEGAVRVKSDEGFSTLSKSERNNSKRK